MTRRRAFRHSVATERKRRSHWSWILLALGGSAGLLVLAVGGLLFWAYPDVTRINRQADTHDLRDRVEKLAESHRVRPGRQRGSNREWFRPGFCHARASRGVTFVRRGCAGFFQANLATDRSKLAASLLLAQQTPYESLMGNVGLCRQIQEMPGAYRFHWHNGGTGGYVSFVGPDREPLTGVVLLADYGDAMAGDNSLDVMGMELLKLAAKVSWE